MFISDCTKLAVNMARNIYSQIKFCEIVLSKCLYYMTVWDPLLYFFTLLLRAIKTDTIAICPRQTRYQRPQ